VADHGAVVPSLWRLEIANSLTGAMRRGRFDAEFRRAALADLAFLDISRGRSDGFQRLERNWTLPIAFG